MTPPRSERFFHYVLADGRLVGSENPFCFPRAAEFIADFADSLGMTRLVSRPEQNVRHVSVLPHDLCPLPNVKLPFEDVLPVARHVAGLVARGERVWAQCSRVVDRMGMVLGGAAVLLGGDPRAVADELLAVFNARYRTDLRPLLAHQRSILAAFEDERGREPPKVFMDAEPAKQKIPAKAR